MTTIYAYQDGRFRSLTIPELFKLRTNGTFDSATVWVDLDNPLPEEEETILIHFFHFHHLAVEDCQRERLEPRTGDHYPKVEDYHDYLYVIFNPLDRPIEELNPKVDDDAAHVSVFFPTKQVNAFLGRNFLVTHHYEPSQAIRYVQELCTKNPMMVGRGPDYLFHMVIDEIVDNYAPVIEYFDQKLSEIETMIFDDLSKVTLAMIMNIKKGIIRLRKITTYQREILNRLARGEFTLVSTQEMFYYRNVYDHIVRIVDLSESYRENVSGLVEAYLSMNSNKMNQVMKVLTVISTIFLPLTFLSSIYGMNFQHMPELEWKYGYYMVWGILILTAATMLFLFKRKGWMD